VHWWQKQSQGLVHHQKPPAFAAYIPIQAFTSEHIRKAENDHGVRPQGVLPANLCKQSLITGNPTLHDDKCF